MIDDSSPPSRWQRLYSSSLNDVEPSNALGSLEIDISDQDDNESITAWLENFPSSESESPKTPLQYDAHRTNLDRDLMYSKEENDADKILDDLELMIRDHDDDFMETILESQRHQDAISQFHTEKRARMFLREWNDYSKSQSSRRQFLFDALNDMVSHHTTTRTFKAWKEIWKKKYFIVEEFKKEQRRKRMGQCLCAWASVMQIQSEKIKVR